MHVFVCFQMTCIALNHRFFIACGIIQDLDLLGAEKCNYDPLECYGWSKHWNGIVNSGCNSDGGGGGSGRKAAG